MSQKHLNQIRKLQDQISNYQSDKEVADKVTTELLQRINIYE